ncbi:MAG: hypothetical protein J6W71_00555 [Methanobrevibacter sp.]|nr:hypothetical protein [Methanobrevibacter sp.]
MTNLTRNGVAKELATSPYIFTEIVNGEQLDIYFSSKLHMNNFIQKRNDNYNMIYNYIYKRFKYRVDCRMLADLNLYTKIETRGFYIKINHKEYVCPDHIILNGENKMKKSYAEWCETLTINSSD